MDTLSEVLDIADYILVMSVNPGFGAQKFIPGAVHEIRRLADLRAQRGHGYRIEVDGGIDLNTVAEVVRAGAEILVAGNAVFGKGDPKVNAEMLLKAAVEATLQVGLLVWDGFLTRPGRARQPAAAQAATACPG